MTTNPWLAGAALSLLGAAALLAETTTVYFGTYTNADSKGIYRSTLNLETGALAEPVLAAEVKSPSFLALAPSGKFLYAVSEISDLNGQKTGGVSAFEIGADGSLKFLNEQPSGGAGPCYVATDKTGKALLVANYGGGSVASYPLNADGSIGKAGSVIQHTGSGADPKRQSGPHAHSINVDPGNKRAFACDLGLDKILIYKLDPAAGTLTPNDPAFVATPPAGGPRHFAFHPSGKFAYTNLEMTLQVSALTYDAATGKMEVIQTLPTVPAGTDLKGMSTAETQVHPNGKFLYVSNRGHDTIAAYAIDQATGQLSFLENESTGGETPRNFGIDPSGRYLIAANQKTGNVVVLRINPETGKLDPANSSAKVPNPVCVKYLVR